MNSIQLLQRLTRFAPAYRPPWPEDDRMVCAYCDAVFMADEDCEVYPDDECAHDETCPWRLAKEYLENLS